MKLVTAKTKVSTTMSVRTLPSDMLLLLGLFRFSGRDHDWLTSRFRNWLTIRKYVITTAPIAVYSVFAVFF